MALYNLQNGVQLFQNYQTKSGSKMFSLEGCWQSEKYDGVRAIYLGYDKLVTTRGDLIRLPSWFIKQFPDNIPLDGELWLDHQRFNDISGLIRSKSTQPEDWRNVKYMVFDIPVAPDSPPIDGESYTELTFESRQKILQKYIKDNDNIILIKQEKITNVDQYNRKYQQIIDNHGEGTIIIQPQSLYQGGKRSGYKQKPIDDSEAVVVGYKDGLGKFTGLVGSLNVIGIDSNGKTLPHQSYSIGTGLTHYQRKNAKSLYPIGTIVVCQYNGLSPKGIPRFPRLKGIRVDSKLSNF